MKEFNIDLGRQRCAIRDEKFMPFPSLVDYKNNMYMCEDPWKIIDFYGSFNDADSLIRWMRERPKGATYLHEVPGNNNVIVIIPTADAIGEKAQTMKEDVFKGLHLIFVESGEYPDKYFNYANSCNVGIARALEYNPEWIIISNDDMYRIDDLNTLTSELSKIPHNVDIVYTKPTPYHSIPSAIGTRRSLLFNSLRKIALAIKKRTILDEISPELIRKFNIRYFWVDPTAISSRILYRTITRFVLTSSFAILRARVCKTVDGKVFDDTYINGVEDWGLSINLCQRGSAQAFIDFKIGDKVGGTLGPPNQIQRRLRNFANFTYFNQIFQLSALQS